MKKTWIFGGAILIALFFSGCSGTGQDTDHREAKVGLKSQKAKDSYSLGFNTGINLKNRNLTDMIDLEPFMAGLRDAATDQSPRLSIDDIQTNVADLNQRISQVQQEQFQKIADEQKKISEEFLNSNAKKKEVTTTDSGLQYTVVTPGKGPRPEAGDTVRVHYRGTLIDGTEFDSSIQRGQPAQFPLQRVIRGWTEGIQLMKVGAKYRFFIPPQLAYHLRPPRGSSIPPNATLIFDVELLGIVDGEEQE